MHSWSNISRVGADTQNALLERTSSRALTNWQTANTSRRYYFPIGPHSRPPLIFFARMSPRCSCRLPLIASCSLGLPPLSCLVFRSPALCLNLVFPPCLGGSIPLLHSPCVLCPLHLLLPIREPVWFSVSLLSFPLVRLVSAVALGSAHALLPPGRPLLPSLAAPWLSLASPPPLRVQSA